MLFLAGFFLSLLGSLPPGLISLTVAQTAIRCGLAAALILSAGAAMAEFIQAWLAAEAAGWFMQHPAVEQGLRWAAVPIFLGLGGWLVWGVSSPEVHPSAISNPTSGVSPVVNPTPDPSPKGEGRSDIHRDSTSRLPAPLGEGSGVGLKPGRELVRFFLHGVLISLFNLLAIPYWLAYCAGLRTTDWWQEGRFSTAVFSIGVTVGTFTALAAYAALGHFAVHRSRSVSRWANKVVGAIFIGLGLKILAEMAFN